MIQKVLMYHSFLTVYSQFVDRNALQVRHISKGRENDEPGQDAGDGIDDGYGESVPVRRGDAWFRPFPSQIKAEWTDWKVYFKTLLLKVL